MPQNKHLRFLLQLVYLALGVAGGWLFLTVLLPWLLPFLLALGLAWLLERPILFLSETCHIKRWISAALCTLLLVALLCSGLGLLLWRIGYEIALLLGRLPTLLAGLPTAGHALEDWSYRFVTALPVQFQEFFKQALAGLISQGITLPNRFYDALASLVSSAATALPGVMLFLFTTTLATYFSTASRPQLMTFLTAQIPPSWQPRMTQGRTLLKGAFGGWLRAQGLLMLVTFGLLTVGLFFLRVDLALLLAALIALVDALPIFGTATILFPWAAVAALSGDWTLALGLLLLYGLGSFIRSLLEPKLIGDRIGLPPLAALVAMYLGFSAFGVWGMIFSPLVAIFIKQLNDCGVIKLWHISSPQQKKT